LAFTKSPADLLSRHSVYRVYTPSSFFFVTAGDEEKARGAHKIDIFAISQKRKLPIDPIDDIRKLEVVGNEKLR
jgi:hypothetical protein